MEKVFQYIEENKESYIKWLQDLVRQPSVSAQNRGIRETAAMVKEFLELAEAEVEIVETSGNPVVYGEIKVENTKTLSFYNHYDVVPEEPLEAWDLDPFGGEIKDGKLFSRGACDNKGSMMARICAVHAYKKVYGKMPSNIKFVIEGEEEVGSPHINEFKEQHPEKFNTDGYIWEGGGIREEDGTMQVALGVKGTCYVELKVKGAKSDIHSSEAAIIENPAWRLVWALGTLKNDKEEILIDGFHDGITKPSSEELNLINEMSFDEQEKLNSLELKNFLLELSGNELKQKLLLKPTCTICGIDSGYTGKGSKTVLPSVASAKIDFRLVPGQEPEKIADLLREHLDKHGFEDIELEVLTTLHPFKTDLSDPLAKAAMRTAEEVYKKSPNILPILAGSSSIYKILEGTEIPAVIIGVANANSNLHGPNENIYIRDFIDAIKHTASIIHEFPNI